PSTGACVGHEPLLARAPRPAAARWLPARRHSRAAQWHGRSTVAALARPANGVVGVVATPIPQSRVRRAHRTRPETPPDTGSVPGATRPYWAAHPPRRTGCGTPAHLASRVR